MALEIRLFGALEVMRDGVPWRVEGNRRQVGWLLAYLVLQGGQAVERGRLAYLLWPESGQSGRGNLRDHLRYLRQALGPEAARLISPTPRTLALDLTGVFVDVLTFDAALQRGDAASLAGAVSLYRGPLLRGCPHPWAFEEQKQRESAFVGALAELAEEARARGDAAAAGEWLERAASEAPLSEALLRVRMELLVEQGERPQAIALYHDFRQRRLAEGARYQPDRETAALVNELNARASDRPQPAVIPQARYRRQFRTRLLGREKELAEVARLLARERLVTLVGPAGVGKTVLADGVAHGVVHADRYEGGAFVGLDAIEEAAMVPEAVAHALGVSVPPGGSTTEALVAWLAPQRYLLVLDNCEHLLEGCARLVDGLLRDCPDLGVLATSREGLGLVDEVPYAVLPLTVPPPTGVRASALPEYAAARLFLTRAGVESAALDDETTQAVGETCRRLDGLPLALELAAAPVKIGALSLRELASSLQGGWDHLGNGGAAFSGRHRSLERAIDWSYGLLSEEERWLFRRLSVFAGGFDTRAMGAFPAGGGMALLLRLVGKSLVVAERRGEHTRYRLLESVRAYAAQKLQAAGEAEEAIRQHALYFRDWTEAVGAALVRTEPQEALARLEREIDNLRAAIERAEAAGHVETALRLVTAPGAFWYMRGYAAEGRERTTVLLARPEAAAFPEARAAALDLLSVLEGYFQRYERAHALAEALLALRRAGAERGKLGVALLRVGYTAHCCGQYEVAKAYLQESLAIARERMDREAVQAALGVLGAVATVQEEPLAAEAYLEESVALGREAGSRLSLAKNLLRLGDFAERRGDLARARALVEESRALSRSMNDQNGLLDADFHLANLAMAGGDYVQAHALLEERLTAVRGLGRSSLRELIALGNNALHAGTLEEAKSWFREAMTIPLVPVQESRAALEQPLAVVAMYEGRVEEAAAFFEADLNRWRVKGRAELTAGKAYCLVIARLRQGEWAAARALLRECLRLCQRAQYWFLVADALEALAEVELETGDAETAARLLGAAAAQRSRTGLARPVLNQASYDRCVVRTRAALGQEEFDAAWAAGEALSLLPALALALAEPLP